MNTLQELERRIEEKIAVAHQQKRPVQTITQQQAAEAAQAQRRFGEVADHLLREIICPRIEKLVTYFDNAEILKPDPAERRYTCLCRFRATSRFPATARFELTLAHDEQVEHLFVLYRLEVGPVYVPYKGQVQLVFPFDRIDEEQLIRWLDDQIVDFVDAYLCFEYPGVAHSLVVDPVCGMVLNKHQAATEAVYLGKTHYFCADNCRKKFVQDPERYLPTSQTSLGK